LLDSPLPIATTHFRTLPPDMKIEDAIRIALEAANEPSPPIRPKAAHATPTNARAPSARTVPPKVAEALVTLQEIANGARSLETNYVAQSDQARNLATIKSLCAVVAELTRALAEANNSLESADTPRQTRGAMPLEDYLTNVERQEIASALDTCRHNATEAARLLGLSYRALRYKLEKHGYKS